MTDSPYASNTYHEENENTSWYKILRMIPSGASVLDVGCSSGNLGEYLIQKNIAKKVDGVEIDKGDAAKAAKKLNKVIHMNVETDSFSKLDRYDVIIFADVLEHMKDATAVLERMKDLLKPGGRIIFSIPNMAHLFVRLQLLEGRFSYTQTGLLDRTHLHFYDEDEVRRIFSEAGFTIKKFDCTILDYPDQLIQEKLSKVGLKSSPEFLKLAHRKTATIFEFIGYSEIGTQQKPVPLATSSPLDEVLAFVQRVKDSEADKVANLEKKVQLSQKQIDYLEKERDALLNKPLKTISKSYASKTKKIIKPNHKR